MSTKSQNIKLFITKILRPAAWLVLLSTPTLIFLLAYIGLHDANVNAILPHLHIFALLLTGALGLRIFAGNLTHPSGRSSRVLRAGVTSIFLYALITYYVLAVIGLYSWSRIFTLDLVSAYFGRPLLQLLDSFGIPWILFFAFVTLGLAIIYWILHYFEKTIRASAPFPAATHRLPSIIIGLLLILISTFGMLGFSNNPRGDVEEPFALTFFPSQFGDPLQSISMNHALARRYDAEANQERSNYRLSATVTEKPTLILFIVDGLRPDHMGVLGYCRNTTPFLNRLSSNGKITHLGNLHSVCADSTCGLVSLASSRYPHELSSGFFSLYEVLGRARYRTSLILSGDHKGFYGLGELYGDVDSLVDGNSFAGTAVNDDNGIFEILQSLPEPSGSPSFFQFHLMSAHNLGTRWEHMQEFKPSKNYGFRLLRGSHEESINFYDNGVRQTDHAIERIMLELQNKGYLDRYIAIITSDHGEALGERGAWGHSEEVIEPALRIPLVIISGDGKKEPGKQPSRIYFGSIVDIAPTILDLLTLPRPSTWSGKSLLEEEEPRTIFFRQEERAGLVQRTSDGAILKYWRNIRTGKEFVFDLISDPLESRNLLDTIPNPDLGRWRLKTLNAVALIDARNTE